MSDQPRPRPVMQSPPGPETVIDGRRYFYFAGTSYLGLHGEPSIIEAACEATRKYGIHTATSRRGFGNCPPTMETERLAAKFFGAEEAFYFPSGYMGTAVLAFALNGLYDVILADQSWHFSMMEAARLPGLPIHHFKHRDLDDFTRNLRAHAPEGVRPLVLTDGIFSSTGELAPLAAYLQLLDGRPGAALLVDDAHGVGAVGPNGRGTLEYLGLYSRPINACAEEIPPSLAAIYVCGTLSKAIGGFGGIIAGTRAFIERARSSSHYFDGASAPAAPVAAASARALEIVMSRPELRAQLASNVQRMRTGLRALGLEIEDSPAPIVAACCGKSERMQRLHEELKERGFLVPYVKTYAGSGPEGQMRIAVCAAHTEAMIDALLGQFKELL